MNTKRPSKPRGDASLFVPGVGRREFVRRVGTFAAAAAAITTLPGRSPGTGRPGKDAPIMLSDLNHSMFATRLGEVFEATIDAGTTIPFELLEATLLPAQSKRPAALGSRAPFSLLFRAPRGTQIPQRIYELRHAALGTFGIFLVPIGPDQTGPRYEAVFN